MIKEKDNEQDREADMEIIDLSKIKKLVPDMKNILGYLNQGEWTVSLSIG